ncbi:MAG: Glyoxalase/bleomycin resistance protein/dioxygenase [Phycisphaerales bacterium]|nr:Glyoxalase/bleomycin resistance protein/dioxygenase [Phycisphaerales bacterium]
MGVEPVPAGFHMITPYVMVEGVGRLIDFLQRAVGAEIAHLSKTPDGLVMHASLRVGDSMLMLADARPPQWPARPSGFYVYVPNVDEMYERAMAAGAGSINAPRDEFYGDRMAGVTDPSGNQWWFATHVEDVSEEEMKKRQAAMFGKK